MRRCHVAGIAVLGSSTRVPSAHATPVAASASRDLAGGTGGTGRKRGAGASKGRGRGRPATPSLFADPYAYLSQQAHMYGRVWAQG